VRKMVNWHVGKDFDTTLERYVRYLRDYGYRESSIERYERMLHGFLKFTETSHPANSLADEYRAHLIDVGQSPSTINNTCFAIGHFYKMCGENWKAPILPVHNAIPHFFTNEEVARIFSAASYNLKHLAMFQTMFYGCLRATELCMLEDRDLDLRNLAVLVRHGKGDKEGICLISPQCASTLRRYLDIRPPTLIDGKQYLFYTDRGNRWNRIELNRVFMYIKKRAGVDRPGGLHVFGRHTPATLMIAQGSDIRVVQTIMRHNDIKTTLRYAHVSDTTKRTMYDKFLTV
jgi:integrase/recombinase XerD